MAELSSSPVLARSVDRDLAGTQDGPHVTARVDQAGQLQQLAQADRGPADLHNGLGRRAGRMAGHHQTVSWIARQPVPAAGQNVAVIDAVIFDLDGVLVESEQLWDAARRELVTEAGGTWRPEATGVMQGMSSTEWSAYLHDALGVPMDPGQISDEVVARLLAMYRAHLPLLPGAVEAVQRLGARWPLGLASSSNRPVIDAVLDVAGLAPWFRATVSSEEVPRGKPSPDVYLEAARRLDAEPARCAAVEDSANGARSAVSAGMTTLVIPNRRYPPPADVRAAAAAVLGQLADLTVAVVERAAGGGRSD
jgi:HAD superfamily hydrolase (TIGR01509 family)